MRATAFLLAAGFSGLSSVVAWGAAGHEVVATIAQMYLHPSVLPQLCDILHYEPDPDPRKPPCHIAPLATWADRIRYIPGYRWSASLHYVGGKGDHPSDTCLFPGVKGWEHEEYNVLSGIRNVTGILESGTGSPELENEALKFLLHFLGDVHQPLHLTGRERGGNGAKVTFDGRVTNLHSIWDNRLLAQTLRTLPYNYTRPLPLPAVEYNLRGAIYDPYIRRIVWQGLRGIWSPKLESWLDCPSGFSKDSDADTDVICPFAWASHIHPLNCEFIWPKQLDEPPYSDSAYSKSWFDPIKSLWSASGGHYDTVTPEESVAELDTGSQVIFKDSTLGENLSSKYLELDTPAYSGYIGQHWVVEELLAKGGIRLAGILNYLYAKDGGEGVRLYFAV